MSNEHNNAEAIGGIRPIGNYYLPQECFLRTQETIKIAIVNPTYEKRKKLLMTIYQPRQIRRIFG